MNFNPVQIAVTVIAAVLLMSPLLLWAYQAGRGASSTGKSDRFNRVVAEVHLNDTSATNRCSGVWRGTIAGWDQAQLRGSDPRSATLLCLARRYPAQRMAGCGVG